MKYTLLEEITTTHNRKRVTITKGSVITQISYSGPVVIAEYKDIRFSVRLEKLKLHETK